MSFHPVFLQFAWVQPTLIHFPSPRSKYKVDCQPFYHASNVAPSNTDVQDFWFVLQALHEQRNSFVHLVPLKLCPALLPLKKQCQEHNKQLIFL